jgi:hypothetical protein
MAFYVELPADKYGNRAFTNSFPCVVEGDLVESNLGTELVFKAPKEIASKWPRILFNQYGGWLEVEGPARPLSWDERENLILGTINR